MMREKISIIVPVYNSSKYLRKCIESIIGQTYENLEIILVNDGSKDDSGTICDEYAEQDERIIVIHQQNMGASIARNRGLDICTGAYIGFVDGDDRIAENMYEVLHTVILKYSADISICGYYVEDDENGVYGARNNDGKTTVYCSRDAIREVIEDKKIYSNFWDKLYRREMFAELRFRKGVILEDIATMYKIFMNAEKIVAYNVPQYYYFQRKDSLLHIRNEALNWDQFCVYKESVSVLEKDYPELRELLVTRLVSFGIAAYNCLLLKSYISPEEEKQKKEIFFTIKEYEKEIQEKVYGKKEFRYRIKLLTKKNYDKIYPLLKKIWIKIRQGGNK